MRSITAWTVTLGVAAIALATNIAAVSAMPAVSASPANVSSVQEIRLRDSCDAASFNAVLGAGTCVGDGDTTFTDFDNELTQRGFIAAWKFDPDHVTVANNTSTVLVNGGGEAHTFTRVTAFGGGFVASLNRLSGNPTPAAQCASVQPDGTLTPAPASRTNIFVPAQRQVAGPPIGPGTTRYQCCVHPWMRLLVTSS